MVRDLVPNGPGVAYEMSRVVQRMMAPPPEGGTAEAGTGSKRNHDDPRQMVELFVLKKRINYKFGHR
jgi:hypothetical protein